MNISSLQNNNAYPYINLFVNPVVANLTLLGMQVTNVFLEQTKNIVLAGAGVSAIGAVTSFYNNNTWIFYASGCAVCLGTAYRQGWLEQALFQAEAELARLRNSLTVAETSLSDRKKLLEDLNDTKKKLTEVSSVVVTAEANEKALIAELATTREKQKELSNVVIVAEASQKVLIAELADTKVKQKELSNLVVKLTAIVSFFEGLKDTYPDQKLFFEQLASIEKITRATKAHLENGDVDLADKLTELKVFLEKLDKQDLDKMGLLIEMSKDIKVIKKDVVTANNSLDKVVGSQVRSA